MKYTVTASVTFVIIIVLSWGNVGYVDRGLKLSLKPDFITKEQITTDADIILNIKPKYSTTTTATGTIENNEPTETKTICFGFPELSKGFEQVTMTATIHDQSYLLKISEIPTGHIKTTSTASKPT
ncbi:hypothetical protein BB560_004953 [Smittium megazygosporum]|uniref:Uncharacterized protein n=1 Tax=Smittium megazygosporum TaxID=133381 RepID=A0A2T9Z7S9_9FUNG|nr:hypothetical protein BB560_004953 [Smittium megazygosporum]